MFLFTLSILFLNASLLCTPQAEKADNFIRMGLVSQDLVFDSLENPTRAMSHMASSIYFNVQAMQNGKEKAPSYIIDPANNPELLNLFKKPVMRKGLYAAIHKNKNQRHTLSKKNCTDIANLVRYNGKLTEIIDTISHAQDSNSLHLHTKRYIKTFSKMLSVYNPELVDYKNKLLTYAHESFKQNKLILSCPKTNKKLVKLNEKYEQESKIYEKHKLQISTVNRLFKNSVELMKSDKRETRECGYANFYKAFHKVMFLPDYSKGYREALIENAFSNLNSKLKSKELKLPSPVANHINTLAEQFINQV